MKILIADDERLVRYSLKSMLEEIGVPARSIEAAADGEEMLQAASRSAPDIAFVDVRMPRLDGLAGIERGRKLSPGTRWIVLTSHSSFEYAKKAIELGAADYLLKPVSPDDLRRVISRLDAERRRELSRANEEFESRISSFLHDTLSPSAEMEFVADAGFLCCLLVFDTAADAALAAERRRSACSGARTRLAAAADARYRVCLCALPDGAPARQASIPAADPLAVIGAWKRGRDESPAREALIGLVKTLQGVLDSAGGNETRVTLFLGEPARSPEELKDRIEECATLSPARVVLGIGRCIHAEEARETARGRLAPLCTGLADAARAWRCRDRLELLSALDRAKKAFPAVHESRGTAQDAVSRNIGKFLQYSMGVRLAVSAKEDHWLDALEEQGRTVETSGGGDGQAGLVERTAAYARSHFREDAGIARVAGLLGVTPNYLSWLFHKTQGITFVKYVTRLRMEAARDRLASGCRVQEAAHSVGYASVRYFSTTFMKHFGHHPSRIGEKSS